MQSLLSFAVVAALLTVVPGLDTAVVLRTAVTRGRREAFATAVGIGCGTLAWGVAAAAGVSALIVASEVAYAVVRVAGAVYLLWFGIGMIRTGFRRTAQLSPEPGVGSGGGVVRAWARGVGTNLLNPKVGVFYVAALPQFLPDGVAPLAMGCAMAVVHNVEGMLWFTAVIAVAGSARTWLSRTPIRRTLDVVTGSVVAGFGVRLAVADR